VKGRVELGRALDAEIHDDRLDVDLTARLIELSDHLANGRIVVRARGDDERVRRLFCADLHGRLEDAERARPLVRVRGGGAVHGVVEGADDLLRVRVLEHHDVHLPLARRGHVDGAEKLEQPLVPRLRADHEERVRPLERDELRHPRVASARGRLGRLVGCAFGVEQLVELLLHVVGRGVCERLEPHLVFGLRDVELVQDAHHPVNVRAGVGQDEDVAVGEHRPLFRGELREDGLRDFVGRHVRDAMQVRHEARLGRYEIVRSVDRRFVPRLLRVDDLREAPVRDDREVIRRQQRQERFVRFCDRHLVGGDDRRLKRFWARGEEEALPRQIAHRADDLGEIRVLERDRHELAGVSRGVVERRRNRRVVVRGLVG
jgi:hypothetical protein